MTTQISSKVANFEHMISLGNVILCHKDIHSLLLEWFITIPISTGIFERASDIIHDSLMVNTASF